MTNIVLVLILIILIVVSIICGFDRKENFQSILNNVIIFGLKSQELSLEYFENNFYFTSGNEYIFIGILDNTNGLYKLQDGIKKLDYILNFNVSDASNSHISFEYQNPNDPNFESNPKEFNGPNRNIYWDPINKIVKSNDDSENDIYLTYFIHGSPVRWDYSIDNADIFDINYL